MTSINNDIYKYRYENAPGADHHTDRRPEGVFNFLPVSAIDLLKSAIGYAIHKKADGYKIGILHLDSQ